MLDNVFYELFFFILSPRGNLNRAYEDETLTINLTDHEIRACNMSALAIKFEEFDMVLATIRIPRTIFVSQMLVRQKQ